MLELDEPTLSFEPDKEAPNEGLVTRNFFDVNSKRICTIRNNGNLGLTVKTLGQPDTINVRTRDRGEPLTVKFSPNGSLCLVQGTQTSMHVIFLEKTEANVCVELAVTSKRKEPLLCVEWTSETHILLVTSQSIELIMINMEKKSWKSLRTMNISANWAFYYPNDHVLFVANGQFFSNIQPIVVNNAQFVRLKSVEVEFIPSPMQKLLLVDDFCVANIYGSVYFLILRNNTRNASIMDLLLYQVPDDIQTEPILKFSLVLGLSYGCSVHVIDNLIIVHHQASKQSLIFDIAMSGAKQSLLPLATTKITASKRLKITPEMYSCWLVFPDRIIIDSRNSMIFSIALKNNRAEEHFREKSLLLEYLSRRSDAKGLFLETLLRCLTQKMITLRRARKIFYFLTKNLTEKRKDHPNESSNRQVLNAKPHRFTIISQQDMLATIFIPMKDDVNVVPKYLGDVMLQYLRALVDAEVQVEAYLLEVLVQSLVDAKEMTKLHQLVTYGVISDSKPLAFLFLSLQKDAETSLIQCGIDVLARNKCSEEIVDILLQNEHNVSAIRFIESKNLNDSQLDRAVESSIGCSRVVKHAIGDYVREKKTKRELKKVKS